MHPFKILLETGYIAEEDINQILKIKKLDRLFDKEVKLVQLYIINYFIVRQNGSLEGLGDNNDL